MINETPVKAVFGEDKVEGLTLDEEDIAVDGIFVAMGSASSADLATKLGIYVENGRIVVNEEMETNLPGLYAAGDCTPGVQQIAKAVSDGCIAAYAMLSYIRSKKREMKQ